MLKFIDKRWFSLFITIIFAIGIFYLSSRTFPPGPKIIDISIIYHALVFFYFSFFLLLSIKGQKKLKLKHIILALIIGLVYAASDEIHQAFVPGRVCTFPDFLTDSAGILTSVFLISVLSLKRVNFSNSKHD